MAAIARGHGFTGVTIRAESDIAQVETWLSGPRDTPLLVDLKVNDSAPSWWLSDAFKAEA